MFQLKFQLNRKSPALRRPLRRSTQSKGSVLMIVAMSMPMIMGFCALAIDYGIMNVDANRLQRACDAAALAGAAKLKKTNDAADVPLARAEAISVAGRNGVTITDANITFPVDTVSPVDWTTNSRIRVEGTVTRPLLFTRLWKMYSTTMFRHATAELTAVAGLQGTVPLVITTNDFNTYNNGTPFTLTYARMQSRTDFAPGFIVGISTDPSNNGKSSSDWETDVRNGTTDIVRINDNNVAINASFQNATGRLDNALDARIAAAAAATWNPGTNPSTTDANNVYPNYPGSASRRIFTVVVADPTAASTGNQNIVVLRFVRVYLVASDNGRVTLRLMPNAAISSEATYVTGNGATNTGLSFVRMIDDIG